MYDIKTIELFTPVVCGCITIGLILGTMITLVGLIIDLFKRTINHV